MLAKILMPSCYVQKFHDEDHEYVKKLCHFKCKCNDSHLMYILSCEKHPLLKFQKRTLNVNVQLWVQMTFAVFVAK